MEVYCRDKVEELSMASYIKNGLTIGVPNASVVDLEVALRTKSMNELAGFFYDLLIGFRATGISQVFDIVNPFLISSATHENKDMTFLHIHHLDFVRCY